METSESPLPPIDGMFRRVTDVAWDPQATPISATATSIPASPSTIMDGNWVKSWGEFGTGPGQFHCRTCIARLTPRATSMWPIAVMDAFRSSTATET